MLGIVSSAGFRIGKNLVGSADLTESLQSEKESQMETEVAQIVENLDKYLDYGRLALCSPWSVDELPDEY